MSVPSTTDGSGGAPVLPAWPSPPDHLRDDPQLAKALYLAQLREAAAARARVAGGPDAQEAASDAVEDVYSAREWETLQHERREDAELYRGEHGARLEVAKGSIDRGRAAAEFARNAAAAIGSLYTGLLGVTFAVSDQAKPLPARGVIPAVFLGLSLVCATAYAAVMRAGKATTLSIERDDPRDVQEARLNAFTRWTSEIARRNAWALHAAVFSLGAGVLFLPVAFVAWTSWTLWALAVAALAAVLLGASFTTRALQRAEVRAEQQSDQDPVWMDAPAADV
jgi:hypothetical protein